MAEPCFGNTARVDVELNVEVLAGHPAQVLALLREHLNGLTLDNEEHDVLACVQVVTKIGIG